MKNRLSVGYRTRRIYTILCAGAILYVLTWLGIIPETPPHVNIAYIAKGDSKVHAKLSLWTDDHFVIDCHYQAKDTHITYDGQYTKNQNTLDLYFKNICEEQDRCSPVTAQELKDLFSRAHGYQFLMDSPNHVRVNAAPPQSYCY